MLPALGSMAAVLLFAGLGGEGALAARSVLAQQAGDASVLHVYLRDGAPSDQVGALRHRLESDGRVRSVRYVSSREALRAAHRRPGLDPLVEQLGANPLPASLEVHVRAAGEVRGLAVEVRGDPALVDDNPTWYDTETYGAMQAFLRWAALVSSAFVLALALVAAAVTASAVRAAILTRWDDVSALWLVGAAGWLIRGPFVVEGTLTGGAAGLAAAALLLCIYAVAHCAGRAALAQVLPGVGWGGALACGAAVLAAGLGLGSLAAVTGLRTLAGLGRR